ncbi:MAG: NADH-quinone oxidoreductase subunit NuoK [Chloroflexi bacterium]|nr:NADH-quinone oxidoreductase subunit NuoK [Chloroflexota bacterium]
MNLENFLIVAAIIFSIGLYGAMAKRNAITVLMSIELMFNSVNITAVAFSRYVVPQAILADPQTTADTATRFLLTGQIFSVFIITVAAAEVALGLAIVLAMFRQHASIFVTDAAELKK